MSFNERVRENEVRYGNHVSTQGTSEDAYVRTIYKDRAFPWVYYRAYQVKYDEILPGCVRGDARELGGAACNE
jgi:hypothetical protein